MTDNDQSFYVYLHRRNDTNGIFYIGKGKGRRAWGSYGRNKAWKDIAREVGFSVEIFRDGLSECEAFRIEKKIISILRRFGPISNIADGGKGGTAAGYKHPPEIKLIISNSQKGMAKSEEHKAKLRAALTGKPLRAETKAKMSAVRRAKGTNHLEGIRKTQRHKDALSIGSIGKKHSQNKSGYVGVYWHKRAEKWAAVITISGKARHLGLFRTAEEASEKYQREKWKVMKEKKYGN